MESNHYLISEGQFWHIKGATLIGHSPDASIFLKTSDVSEFHCRIEQRGQNIYLKDLNSASGTFLNGTQVVEAILNEGDIIGIGNYRFRFSNCSPLDRPERLKSKNAKFDLQLSQLPHLAPTDHSILIEGPSGTGKDVLAQHLHQLSKRRFGPFVSVNCSALTENLIESELFGHVKGAFTGAIENRKGAFETARGGTLFLDEIGDLSPTLQAKLLRALENQEIRPVGSDRILKTDVRIIAATHQNLLGKIAAQEFRSDLYFRLNVIQITTPALKYRLEDFEELLYKFCKSYRISFSFAAIQALKNHSWPGNIRELKNVVARAAALFREKKVDVDDLSSILTIDKGGEVPEKLTPARNVIREIERKLILETLEKFQGNQARTAKMLGLPRSTLHDRIRNYKIDPTVYC